MVFIHKIRKIKDLFQMLMIWINEFFNTLGNIINCFKKGDLVPI